MAAAPFRSTLNSPRRGGVTTSARVAPGILDALTKFPGVTLGPLASLLKSRLYGAYTSDFPAAIFSELRLSIAGRAPIRVRRARIGGAGVHNFQRG